jgi:hypothetical protein
MTGLEIREYGRRNPSRWQRGTLYPQKLALTSLTSGGRSVGIVRSLAQATEFCLFVCLVFEMLAWRMLRKCLHLKAYELSIVQYPGNFLCAVRNKTLFSLLLQIFSLPTSSSEALSFC